MAEVESLNVNLEQTIEAWNGANIELDKIRAQLASNSKHLVAARKSLVAAQGRIAERLRDLYVNGSGDSTLEVLLGASSLDDIVTRLDAISRVSTQDAEILQAVKRYRTEVETRRVSLREARESQARIVKDQASKKAYIESQIAEQNRMLSSVKDEIARIQAEERRRQAELAAQARARAAAQQAAAQAAAAQQTASPTYEPAIDPSTYNLPAAKYGGVVAIALQYLGIPYVWGGSSPATGFDCSGFTMYVYAQVGVSLPHHAASQYQLGVAVPRDQLAPGDLVFFSGLGHMGIYIGGGQFVHAPHTGDVVKISSLSERWGNYVGARRIL
ncbi:MAG TPA: NlpC/P60 family protein [Gaiellaceae bacterium]|nr:NlpC/P60 family protein [Gaiellaceae bacterium]